MEIEVSVDCHSVPRHILVLVRTSVPFEGLVYVSDRYGDLNCTAFGQNNETTLLKLPLIGCSTREKSPGLFMSNVTVQQHPMIVSEGDEMFEVGCKMFSGVLSVGLGNTMDISGLENRIDSVTTAPLAPEVILRVYDFENDAFLQTVHLGQVVELEITIRDGKIYQGSISDCDAINHDGTRFPIVRNFCPVDPSISEKVYVDDQSRTTGDYYLYVPFKMFRFLDGSKVQFSCNVIVCQHDCPWADCGDFLGMSYGRKKRSPPRLTEEHKSHTISVSNEVTVTDDDTRLPRSAGTGIVIEEDLEPPKTPPSASTSPTSPPGTLFWPVPLEYLVGGAALITSLIASVGVNIYLLIYIRRRMDKEEEEGSVCSPSLRASPFADSLYRRSSMYDRYNPTVEWKFESREILYPPMPIRHARTPNRSHSFRY